MLQLRLPVVDPELRHLRSFLVLAEELNFTRAAARLHVAQQALSTQVRQLEGLLGTPLFTRTTRKVELTGAGRVLLEQAPGLLAAVEDVFASVRETAPDSAILKLGLLNTAGLDITGRAVRAFAVEQPTVHVALHNYRFADDRSAGVRQGETDVSIVFLPFRSTGMALEPLYEDPRVALLSSTHPLTGRDELHAAELATHPWIVVTGMDRVAEDYWTLADYREGPATVGANVTDLDEYFTAIRTGQAVAAPTVSMTQALGWTDLVTRPIIDLPPAQVALCWRADIDSPLRDDFLRVVRSQRAA